MRSQLRLWSLIAILLAYGSAPVSAQQSETPRESSAQDNSQTLSIDLFYAMDQRQVDVKFIPRGADRANVIVTNLTREPLELRMPNTFAGVPVVNQVGRGQRGPVGMGQAARPPILGQFGLGPIGGGQFGGGGPLGGGQFGGGQFGGGPLGGQFGGGQPGMGGGGQGLGGGFNQGGGGVGLGNGLGMQNGGRGNGLFRVAADRPLKISVQTVCLEHGKPDPNPRMKYQLIPLAAFNPLPEIEVLCRELSAGNASQNVAQAAAWNIANGLSWEELAKKNRRESQYTGNEKFFTPEELRQALKFTAYCRSQSEKYASTSGQ